MTTTPGLVTAEARRLGTPRWSGRAGRLEVWYATATSADGMGYWIHHEILAPTGTRPPYAHGWVAMFDPDRAPLLAHFGPEPVAPGDQACWFRGGKVTVEPGRMSGTADNLGWDLAFSDDSAPLYTFPKTVWERELSPGAQVVACPQARFTGTITIADHEYSVDAVGAVARIYSKGNPARWCWLHAQLDQDTVIEAVAAVANRPLLRLLAPLTMLRLRAAGEVEWPPPLASVTRLRTKITPPGAFRISGSAAGRHLSLKARLTAQQCVSIGYVDPDGSSATCTNSERADVEVSLGDDSGRVRRWELTGRAHAEIGTRP